MGLGRLAGLSAATACALAVAVSARAGVRYVNVVSDNPVPPYTNWAYASRGIQQALDVAQDGDLILVTNGLYALSERVAVTRGVTIRSMGGPSATIVDGGGRTRCFFLSHTNATLDGFTIRNGGGSSSGVGVYLNYGGIVQNCVIESNTANKGAGAYLYRGGSLLDCAIRDNAAHMIGGGAVCDGGGTLVNCTITGNTATNGGGVFIDQGGALTACLVEDNRADWQGGGVCGKQGELMHCRLLNNRAREGGGAYLRQSVLRNGLIVENAAVEGAGGGAYMSDESLVQSCTFGLNRAAVGGGLAAVDCTVESSILYGNEARIGPNWHEMGEHVRFLHVCAWPQPPGNGNIQFDPEWIDPSDRNYRLRPGSPCIESGKLHPWMYEALDMDGAGRIFGQFPDIGAHEFRPGALSINLTADPREGVPPFDAVFYVHAAGPGVRDLYCQWDFDGDGHTDMEGKGLFVVTNRYETMGLYTAALAASVPNGSTASVRRTDYIKAAPAHLYVAPSGGNIPPYDSWAKAATSIRTAVDAAPEGAVIWVTNGAYAVERQIDIDRGLTLRGLRGARNTLLSAGGAGRLFYLSHPDAVVEGFTLMGGQAGEGDPWGGGVVCTMGATLRNCAIRDCRAAQGGGVFADRGGLVDRCFIYRNAATNGGGVYGSGGARVERSEMRGNDAVIGAGAYLTRGAYLRSSTVNSNHAFSSDRLQTAQGGGVFCDRGAVLDRCLITNNLAEGDFASSAGGGVFCGPGGELNDCRLLANRVFSSDPYSTSSGGGLYAVSGTVVETSIRWNRSSGHGGGACIMTNAEMRRCVVSDNTAAEKGGGVVCSRARVARSTLEGNSARNGGGGFFVRGMAENLLAIRNRADVGGGLVAVDGSRVQNCTVANNEAEEGGGLITEGGCRIVNSILYDNTAETDANWRNHGIDYTYLACCTTPQVPGLQNIDADPLFRSPPSNAYQLLADSPCVAAGVKEGTPEVDLDGQPRPSDGRRAGSPAYDIGAYQLQPWRRLPVLSQSDIQPKSGGVDTVFTFSVHYEDADGDPPAKRRVVIDETPFDMELAEGEPANGRYAYRTRLAPGRHRYYFEFTDAFEGAVRFPLTGSFP